MCDVLTAYGGGALKVRLLLLYHRDKAYHMATFTALSATFRLRALSIITVALASDRIVNPKRKAESGIMPESAPLCSPPRPSPLPLALPLFPRFSPPSFLPSRSFPFRFGRRVLSLPRGIALCLPPHHADWSLHLHVITRAQASRTAITYNDNRQSC